MSIRNYSNTAAQSTLSANIGATDTSIALAGYAGDPTPPFTAALARGTATEEIVLVTAVIGSTVTVTRGYDGTQAQAQSAGAAFQEVVVAADFREANNHVNATGAVHGTASQLVGVSDAQTLTNKTLTAPQVSNLTGTGTTTLAAVTATTLAVSGASTLVSVTVTGASSLATLTTSGLATLAAAQVTATPSVAADVARKDYVDTTVTTAVAAAGTAAGTANTVVRRDTSGNITANEVLVAGQTTAGSATRKDYVDGKFADTGWQNIPLTAPFTTAGEGAHYRVKNGICYLQADIVNNSAWGFGATVFTLPAGARPITTQYPAVMKISGTTRTGTTLAITSTGGGFVGVAGSATDNIVVCTSFPVD